jgi:hypothetical protein
LHALDVEASNTMEGVGVGLSNMSLIAVVGVLVLDIGM